jgi:hypothetical protein
LARDHQAFGPKTLQRGAYHRARYLELTGEVVFPRQAGAVGILAFCDVPADAVMDNVGKKRRARRGHKRCFAGI